MQQSLEIGMRLGKKITGTITSDILVSCFQCRWKAFLLLCTNEKGLPHEHVLMLQQKKKANVRAYVTRLAKMNRKVRRYNVVSLKSGCDFLTNTKLRVDMLEADCDILARVAGNSSSGEPSYEPILFVGTFSISKDQRVALLFAGYVLAQIQDKPPAYGRIVTMGEKSYKVKLDNTSKVILPLLKPLKQWLTTSSPEPPPLILNKHCAYCQYHCCPGNFSKRHIIF